MRGAGRLTGTTQAVGRLANSLYLAAMYQQQHLATAASITNSYKGEMPFAAFLKQFFGLYKKYGSRDRKQISHLCYCGFRTGKALQHLPANERIVAGLWLCSREANDLLAALQPAWNEKARWSVAEKLQALNSNEASVFPWPSFLSNGIEATEFSHHFFTQPHLFIRLRPGFETKVAQQLTTAGIQHKALSPTCLALPNITKLEGIVNTDAEAVVQDASSQQVAALMQQAITAIGKNNLTVWDCCAASGGKSILLFDLQPQVQLTVSDIRDSILQNLKKRFAKAGLQRYQSFTADVSSPLQKNTVYDLVIADVPCTGSGTWARTPEQLYFFDAAAVEQYAAKQKQILNTVTTAVIPGGFLLYITCSVFRQENEEAVQFLQSEKGLTLVEMKTITGYPHQADTLFAALLQRV
jgi:16S rRNA (cytosine967-C5)-methyltransferase